MISLRSYLKEELKKFEVTPEMALIVDKLMSAYPKYSKIANLKGFVEYMQG